MDFVLDASVALAWCFPDETTDYATRVLHRFAAQQAVVPTIWPLEVSNALVVGHRRARIDRGQIETASKLLQALDIAVDELPLAHTFHATIPLALAHQLSVYDAAYLELAQRTGFPLATWDRKLRQAAEAAKVDIL